MIVMGHEALREGPGAGLSKSGRALVVGRIAVSVRCSYLRREAGRREPCRQPIVLVLLGERILYCFPPTWDAIAGKSVEEIIGEYARSQA
jgi:hypothetical protein